MFLRTQLNLTQKQSLVMTPKLQQAIKILQMNRLELSQHVAQEMVENPVLEEDDVIEDASEENEVEDELAGAEDEVPEADLNVETGLPDNDDIVMKEDSPEPDISNDNFGDVNWEEYFDDTPTKGEWEAPLEDDMRNNIAAQDESLEEHLLWQLRMTVTSDDDYAIGEAIIGNIDSNGYLTSTIEEIAESLECEVGEVERVLRIVQAFEPTGVGARDLNECLLIQLQQLGLENTIAYEIIQKDFLKDLKENRFPLVAKNLGVELDLVREAAGAIASLEPMPGRQFSSSKPEYIVPDVTVEKIDGKYTVFMNDYGTRLRLSPYYKDMLVSGNSLPSDTREYIRSKVQSAAWLLESIESRRRTILRVTESIFELQEDFLERGPSYLKPLILREIADRLGVHESTVSRVTRNRYVQTPRGVFELKYFFDSGVGTEGGGMASSESVKQMIKEITDKEDPSKPLSDEDIRLRLGQEGIKIARRTIQKYRAELNIPASSKRKQW